MGDPILTDKVMESMIPALFGITFVAFAFVTGIIAMYLGARSKEQRRKERMLLIEKGMEVPPELYGAKEQKKPNGYRGARAWLLVLGCVMTSIGLGVMIIISAQEGIRQGANGIVPFLIGVGFLVSERMIARLAAEKREGH